MSHRPRALRTLHPALSTPHSQLGTLHSKILSPHCQCLPSHSLLSLTILLCSPLSHCRCSERRKLQPLGVQEEPPADCRKHCAHRHADNSKRCRGRVLKAWEHTGPEEAREDEANHQLRGRRRPREVPGAPAPALGHDVQSVDLGLLLGVDHIL